MQNSEFAQTGFLRLPRALTNAEVSSAEQGYDDLIRRARVVLDEVSATSGTLSAFYRSHPNEVLVVPEAGNPTEPCRLEYLVPCSNEIRHLVAFTIAPLISDQTRTEFVLFKDKCNVKAPGGGAFRPHQDIAAYRHFAPRFHVTAAVLLDNSNDENGCLEMAVDYRDVKKRATLTESRHGVFPVFDSYEGGGRNGDIVDEVATELRWTSLVAERGDIILFDSFVPHRSQVNRSQHNRRMLFFTFNDAAEGDLYAQYYEAKRRDYDNPIFHVSTPTRHAG